LRLHFSASCRKNAQVAQSVEQGTENPRVGSSILSLGTISINGLRYSQAVFLSDYPDLRRESVGVGDYLRSENDLRYLAPPGTSCRYTVYSSGFQFDMKQAPNHG
jgi:hypothetical protein